MDDRIKAENEAKKEYLRSYIPLEKAAKRLQEEIEQLRMDKMFPSMVYDDMPHGTDQSDLSDYMAKLDELVSDLIQARYDRINTYTRIFADIERMDDETEKTVLTYRYLRGYSWENICVKMGYEWAQIHRMHSRALNNFKQSTMMIQNDTQECDTMIV